MRTSLRQPFVPPSATVGLVLGAGGATGAAFHAGTLFALTHDFGWDPRAADVIVGSSAGSVVGALLRAGVSTEDLAAWATDAAPSSDGRQTRLLLDRVDDARRMLSPRLRLIAPRPGHVAKLAGSGSAGRVAAMMSLLPLALVDASPQFAAFGELHDDWPAHDLWLTAVRASDARRVVFGRDAIAPLCDAVSASCAIPGLYRPVRVDGRDYIDGGAHSPTNADLLADAGVDVAVVLAPMAAQAGALGRRPDRVLRMLVIRRLRREVRELERAGIDVRVFQPDAATLRVMGFNALDRARSRGVVGEAFLAAVPQLRDVGRQAG